MSDSQLGTSSNSGVWRGGLIVTLTLIATLAAWFLLGRGQGESAELVSVLFIVGALGLLASICGLVGALGPLAARERRLMLGLATVSGICLVLTDWAAVVENGVVLSTPFVVTVLLALLRRR